MILTAHTAGDSVQIQVQDTGAGIPAEELPQVWERFYRTRDARAGGLDGTGLGLALVKELTEAMGGSVAVSSEVGEGACFTLEFPQLG